MNGDVVLGNLAANWEGPWQAFPVGVWKLLLTSCSYVSWELLGNC